MHIPDGFLDAKVAGTTALVSIGSLWVALRRVPAGAHRRVPLMGVCAAFIFVAQLVNFPVAAGTSGHLVGAALATVLLGPSAAAVVMASVVVVQALLFADGGVLSLGANLLNMAVVAVLAAAATFGLLRRVWPTTRGFYFATALASWSSIVAASGACALELAASHTVALPLALPAMTGAHTLIGLGEALITTLVLSTIVRARPELVTLPQAPAGSVVRPLVATGVVMLALVPMASKAPDGLEKVSESLGFSGLATGWAQAPLGSLPSGLLVALGAAVLGALAAATLAWVVSKALTTPSARSGHES